MPGTTTRQVAVGPVAIGGGAPVSVQTMTRAHLDDIEGSLRELALAEKAGADIARLAVPSVKQAASFGKIAARSPLPLVADTHFDWRIAVAAVKEGAAKIRINPGNMSPDGLARVVDAAGAAGIPIRIGGNSGSIRHRQNYESREKSLPETLADEVLLWETKMRDLGFQDIVISIKANSAADTVAANRLVSRNSSSPLHLGVTAAGLREDSLLKSAAAVGSLLLDGIGDTIRFSFTGDIAGETSAAVDLLRALELRRDRPIIVSCPACGRCRVSLPKLAAEVKAKTAHITSPLHIAVMGCEVNGPGEAKDADLGIASAGGVMHLFIKGRIVGKVPAAQAVERLAAEAETLAGMR